MLLCCTEPEITSVGLPSQYAYGTELNNADITIAGDNLGASISDIEVQVMYRMKSYFIGAPQFNANVNSDSNGSNW